LEILKDKEPMRNIANLGTKVKAEKETQKPLFLPPFATAKVPGVLDLALWVYYSHLYK
jgi:hypothetical protein